MERLIEFGKLTPVHSSQISHSRLGIGFEKLDRNVFDPEKAYDKIAAIGVKWVRIQSGWARTESEKGIYRFEWIDSIVDNLLKRGLVPWVCLCYGNGLYDEKAAKVFGAVGCPPVYTKEEETAWKNYVSALASHFKGRIEYYEVWNEPDGIWCWKNGVNAKEYGQFVIDTAKALHFGDKGAKVIGGSVCAHELSFLNSALASGMYKYIDAVTFHEYTPDESKVFERAASIRALCAKYNKKIEVIQGESGSQSSSYGKGALAGCAWTPRKQAKQLLRHTMADLISGVKFLSYFSSVDMIEALNGTVDNKDSYLDYGYFGVLAADFDENGFATGEYTPKPAYFAFQNICALFSGDIENCELPILTLKCSSRRAAGYDCDDPRIIKAGFKKPNGGSAFVYWNSTDLLTTEFESTITIQFAAIDGELKLIDLYDGKIYKIPDNMIENNGNDCFTLKNIPIKDYPLLLTFGDFQEIKSW